MILTVLVLKMVVSQVAKYTGPRLVLREGAQRVQQEFFEQVCLVHFESNIVFLHDLH